MIKNRLAELLSNRGLKISRVAKEANIARSTLTSAVQNDSEMLKMETINTLCNYLKITPCEFFEYYPMDFEFHFEVTNFDTNIHRPNQWVSEYFIDANIDFLVDLNVKGSNHQYDLNMRIDQKKTSLENGEFTAPILIFVIDDEIKQSELIEKMSELPVGLINTTYKKLVKQLKTQLLEFIETHYIDDSLTLPESEYINSFIKEIDIKVDSLIFQEY